MLSKTSTHETDTKPFLFGRTFFRKCFVKNLFLFGTCVKFLVLITTKTDHRINDQTLIPVESTELNEKIKNFVVKFESTILPNLIPFFDLKDKKCSVQHLLLARIKSGLTSKM
jgi:hypothetical protein